MYRIVHNPSRDLPDTAAFVRTLNGLGQDPRPELRHLFDGKSEMIVARAPGRLDLMGGIADYCGSLVLQLPIQEAAFVAVQHGNICGAASLLSSHVALRQIYLTF